MKLEIQNAVLALSDRIFSEYGHTIKLCAEIEMLFHDCEQVPDAAWQALLDQASRANIPIESVGREQTGHTNIQQYEVRFKPSAAREAADALQWLKDSIPDWAATHHLQADLSACHAPSGLCNGLHWHLHLLNVDHMHVFVKQEEEMSAPLSDVLGGLLHTMPALMIGFAPNDDSYQRLQSGKDHVPTRICWGGNNRSVALRLPESVIPLRHIEHRVCGADADAYSSVWAILVGVHYGLKHQPKPGEQMYGDARRPNDYPMLPASLQAACAAMHEADWIERYEGGEALLALCDDIAN